MKRHVKASSAGSISGSGSSRGLSGRAFATRGALCEIEGSGAPSTRGRTALLALAVAAFALLALAPLSQAKVVINGFGFPGTSTQFGLGGQIGNTPLGVAVNNSGNGGVPKGTTYVVDSNKQRIQRFSPSGDFERAWGQNVVGHDERQLITLGSGGSNSLGGSFSLTFSGETVTFPVSRPSSGGIALVPSAGAVKVALEKLPSIGAGNVAVQGGLSGGGGSFTVRFVGALGGTDLPQITVDSSQLTGTPPLTSSATTVENGSGGSFAGFEVCTAAAQCKDGEVVGTAANGGQLSTPQGVAVNQANGHVYVTENGNRRVSEFDADGSFVRTWGWDTVLTGKPGDVAGTSETQTITLGADTIGGKFSLQFGGQTTGATAFASTVSGSNVLVGLSGEGTTGWKVGQVITGTNVPDDTTITALDISGGTLIMSAPATVTSGSTGFTMTGHDLPWDASPAMVQSALEALPSIGAGNVTVTSPNPGSGVVGGPYTVSFKGALADADVAQLTSSAAGLKVSSGSKSAAIATTVAGKVGGYEICNVAANCKQAAAAGPDGGRFAASIGFPLTDSANNVWVPDATNRRLQKFDSSGNFVAAYGHNVDKLGGAGGLESCTSTAIGACQAGTSGSGSGQFSAANPTRIAFDSAGNLYAIDAGNNRVQKFDPAFTAASNFATATFPPFTTTAPTQVASTQGGTRLVFAVNNNVTASPAEGQLLEIDVGDGSVKDTSLVGAKLTGVSGLAADANSGNLMATTNSATSPRRVLTLSSAPLPDPVIALDPVTTKADTTATFSGTVNPKGGWVSCAFQYSTDQVSWTDLAEPDCDSLAAAGGVQAISQSATGLTPGTHYYVRLSVSRPLATGSAKTTPVKTFDTDGSTPTLSKVDALAIGDTSVRLVATIDPRNSATGYVFQYGTTPALGSSTAPVDIGGGTTPLLVSQVVSGLKANTKYFFRVQATNLVGTSTSPAQTFTTRTEPLPLPDNRAYEQVSPADKNFGGVDFTALPAATSAPDGEAAGFCTASGLPTGPDGQVTGACANYVSRRGDDGWTTKALNPPVCNPRDILDGPKAVPSLNLDYAFLAMPLQGSDCAIPPLDPGAPTGNSEYALYRESLLSDPFDFDLMAPLATDSLGVESNRVSASSADGSHFVFPSRAQQTPDAPAGNFEKLFEWHEGDLSLVSKDPANQPLTTASSVIEAAVNGVSANGDRVFFQNPQLTSGGRSCPGSNCEVYMREDATATHWVSQQECTPACSDTAAGDIFEWASTDGSKVFFQTEGKLIDGDTQAGADLYLYTNSPDPAADPHNLTLISKDNEPADGNVADVRGVIGASEDGNSVFFAAFGQIVPGEPTAAGPKVYRWQWNGGNPTIDYITTLLPGGRSFGEGGEGGDELHWVGGGFGNYPLIRYVTPDGKYLLVQTKLQLDPVVDRDSRMDVYRWGEDDGWVCASCQDPGVPSLGLAKVDGMNLASFLQANTGNTGGMNRELRTVMSDDGRRIFFTTADALVPQDQNGDIEDLYEWHEGTVSLISSGLDQREVLMIGASRSGRDIFFMTFENLVGWDIDKNSDVYDARIGGGFPEPPATGAACEGEACRGASSSAPPASGAGTAVFQGAGNPAPKPSTCPKGKVRRRGECVKKPAKKHAKKKHSKKAGKRAKHSQGRASR